MLWFKAKRYGWGWYPSSLEGWLVLGLYVILEVSSFIRIDSKSHSVSDTLINFIPLTLLLSIILILICYLKGEKPKWNWGDQL